jgi:hypothetical protein
MNFRKLMLAGGALAAIVGAPAQASIVDNPQFRVLGLVIVWGADDTGAAPIVSDFVINSAVGAGDADLIAGDVNAVVTGTLNPTAASVGGATNIVDGAGTVLQSSTGVLDATDSFSAFNLDADTDISVDGLEQSSSFYVASNTAFNINAVATPTTEDGFTLADVGYSLSVTQAGNDGLAFGSAAQLPGGASVLDADGREIGGVDTSINTLAAMTGAAPVFVGAQRTAGTVGSIAEQSVRFDATYTLGGTNGYDLSQGAGEVEANVVYTVFVP